MKFKYSKSLVLVWQIASIEARHLKAATIEPTHLFLGLCKVVDLNLPQIISKDSSDRDEVLEELLREVRKIRTIFRASAADAKILRRRLRSVVAKGRFSSAESGCLHRSPAAREIFSEAEQVAQICGATVYPIHLLYATLMAEDEDRDEILKELKIDKQWLRELVKCEVFLSSGKSVSMRSNSRLKWN
jgi:ATP-dependent Clp protease ATP-binding subunit ClpA